MNKTTRNLAALMVSAISMFSMTSCLSSSEDESGYPVLFQFTFSDSSYDDSNVWNKVYDTTQGSFDVASLLTFSHSASEFEYSGYKYYSWNGFCPSKVNDIADYSTEGWTSHQWAAYSTATDSSNPGYLVGFWDVTESTDKYVSNPSLYIDLKTPAQAYAMTITNNTYSYYCLLNGSAYSKKFGADDYFRLIVKGVRSGEVTGTITLNLAAQGQILDEWVTVSLLSLGEVDRIYFQMESSDTGDWGMNNPAYFCLKNIIFNYDEYPITSNTTGATLTNI